jgi:GT2 family glycosyltransferase
MISFCIITDGKEPAKTQRMIESIDNLFISNGYEIVIAGVTEGFTADTYVNAKEYAESGNLGAMRNAACMASIGDVLVVCDDDLVFHDDFKTGLDLYGEDYEVLSCRILNPDGTRFWDWKIHIDGMNALIPYNTSSELISLTGGLVIMKKEVFDIVQWDDQRGFYELEDVDFSERLKKANISIKMNVFSTVTHDAEYTQNGTGVRRI